MRDSLHSSSVRRFRRRASRIYLEDGKVTPWRGGIRHLAFGRKALGAFMMAVGLVLALLGFGGVAWIGDTAKSSVVMAVLYAFAMIAGILGALLLVFGVHWFFSKPKLRHA